MNSNSKRWYLPSWSETAKLFGWRWVYFLPAVVLIGLVAVSPWMIALRWLFILGKLIVAAFAIPILLFLATAKGILQKRTDPFCIHCGYTLAGLRDNYVCPECGEPYTFADVDDYRRNPDWFISKYKREHGSE